ncbi:hypothetical protein SDC9_151191 [bioreactor metagenome]|uniref:Uncharacterized protein n=1 Tax=bioreactor metagenome TaxID=1076179 RepID=A0A645ER82_9ZZZZ
MKKAYIRVQPHRLQRRGAVVGKQRVYKGKQAVHRVQRRAAGSPLEAEGLPILQHQLAEHAEIAGGQISLQPPEPLLILRRQGRAGALTQLPRRLPQGGCIHPEGMVPHSALQHPPAVIQLGGNHGPSDAQSLPRVVGHTVLGSAQQHVSPLGAGNPPQKAPVEAQKAQGNIPLAAGSHQRGTGPGMAEGDHPLQIVKRHPPGLAAAALNDNILPIQRQIGSRRHHIQGIVQYSHSPSSSPSRAAR